MTPDTYVVPLAAWLLFMVILSVVALRGPAAPRATAALPSDPSGS